MLENRTKQSRNEMDTIEALNELREINARHEKVDHDGMIRKAQLYQQELERLQKEEEDRIIRYAEVLYYLYLHVSMYAFINNIINMFIVETVYCWDTLKLPLGNSNSITMK